MKEKCIQLNVKGKVYATLICNVDFVFVYGISSGLKVGKKQHIKEV